MMKNDGILDSLEAADWDEIILKLVDYARWRARCYAWASGNPMSLPGGKTPEDVAFEAIEKVWQGVRTWDPDKYPNLLTHLKWIVKSDIDHLFFLKEHQSTQRIMGFSGDQEGAESSQKVEAEGRARTPEERLIQKQEEIFGEQVKEALYTLVKGDDNLGMVLLCIEDGKDKPALIAKEMGCKVSEVNNLKKRLRRLVDKAIKEVHGKVISRKEKT